jgi:polyhydroxyalkanoate synthesis regulator phasin
MINTHRLIKRLTSEGEMSEQAAEAVSEAINEALSDSVATKADITAVRGDVALLKQQIDTVETRLSNRLYVVGFSVVLALGVIQHFLK